MRKRHTSKRTIQGRQLDFVNALFTEDEDLNGIMQKYKTSKEEIARWLKDSRFRKEIRLRIRWAYEQSEILVAKYTMIAAARLVSLTESENQETSRRACLDIINLLRIQRQKKSIVQHVRGKTGTQKDEVPEKDIPLTPQQASTILTALAE
jgi:NACalpha-BTF3-like transcription factor